MTELRDCAVRAFAHPPRAVADRAVAGAEPSTIRTTGIVVLLAGPNAAGMRAGPHHDRPLGTLDPRFVGRRVDPLGRASSANADQLCSTQGRLRPFTVAVIGVARDEWFDCALSGPRRQRRALFSSQPEDKLSPYRGNEAAFPPPERQRPIRSMLCREGCRARGPLE